MSIGPAFGTRSGEPSPRYRPYPGRRRSLSDDGGTSLVELLVILALVSVVATMSVPAVVAMEDAGRMKSAAAFLAARLRFARVSAVATHRNVALVFDAESRGWTFRVCRDDDGDGVRRADIAGGVDPCLEGPYALDDMFKGINFGIAPGVPGPEGDPPPRDPIQLGSSDMASFSPDEGGTAGTLFLRSRGGRLAAVRMSNVTGRTRVLRFDPPTRAWVRG